MLIRSGAGNNVVSATGSSESTHASPVLPPRCRLTARASMSSATRTKPPGITRHPSLVRARNSRSVNGRGSSRPLRQTGVVEKRNGLLGHEVDTAVGDLLQYARSLVGLEHRAETLPS